MEDKPGHHPDGELVDAVFHDIPPGKPAIPDLEERQGKGQLLGQPGPRVG